MTPSRSLLSCERVVKATFVYANLRFLNKVADIETKLLEFLVSDEAECVSIEDAARIEQAANTQQALPHEKQSSTEAVLRLTDTLQPALPASLDLSH